MSSSKLNGLSHRGWNVFALVTTFVLVALHVFMSTSQLALVSNISSNCHTNLKKKHTVLHEVYREPSTVLATAFLQKNFRSSTVKRHHQMHPGYPNQSRPSGTKFESAIRNHQKLIKDWLSGIKPVQVTIEQVRPLFCFWADFCSSQSPVVFVSFLLRKLKVECLFAGCTWTRARIAKECTSRVTSPASTRPLIKKPNMRNKKPNNNHLLIHHLFLAFSPKKKLGEKATSFLWVFDAFWWFFARQDDGRHLWWGNSWSNRHKVDGAFRRTAAGKLRTVARGNGWKVDVSSFSSWNFWMIFFEKKDETFGRLNRDGFFRRILERWMFF